MDRCWVWSGRWCCVVKVGSGGVDGVVWWRRVVVWEDTFWRVVWIAVRTVVVECSVVVRWMRKLASLWMGEVRLVTGGGE
eukprot:14118257-Alexandrium_andersonii.AAC.1